MIILRFRRFFNDLAFSGGSSVLFQGSTLLFTLLASNAFGPEGLAKVYITQNTLNTLSSVLQAGLGYTALTQIARYRRNDPIFASRIANLCLRSSFTIGCVGAAALFLSMGLLAERLYGETAAYPYLGLAALALPFSAVGLVQIGVLNGLERFRDVFVSAVVSSLVLLGAGIGLGLLLGPIGAALGIVAAALVRSVQFLWMIRRAMPTEDAGAITPAFRDIWSKVSRFAVPAGLAGLTLTPATWITSGFLANSQGLTELGIFSAIIAIKSAVVFVPQQIGTVLLPRYMNLEAGSALSPPQFMMRFLGLVFLASSFLAIFFVAFGSSVMGFFGSKFVEGLPALKWMMAATVLESLASAASHVMARGERMWHLLIFYTVPKDLALVAMAFWLIPKLGMTGLAIAYFGSWALALALVGILAALHGRPERGLRA